MSVRRLADDHVQPNAFAFKPAFAAQVKVWMGKYPKGREQSAVIPLLMLAQEQDGWVTKAAIEHIAGMLDMPRIRVLEVATFYTQFQLKPVGTRAHVQVCGTTPCMLRGSQALMDVCRSKIHHDQFHTNEAGTLSWEEVECLGACVNAPMVMIFKDTYEDLTPERLAEIIDLFEAGQGEAVTPGPQNGRTFSAPIGKLTSLTDEDAILVKADAKPAKGSAAAAPQAPAKAAAPKVAAKAKAAPKAADKGRPKGIARPKKPDDLKMISGVGPKIEGILHSLGIFTFAQVAAWRKAERDWVDDYLNFKGRIERDEWVKQAAALAKGGRAEYVRVFGKEPR
jgi:NADH-quinone oxidoreductase subunit E